MKSVVWLLAAALLGAAVVVIYIAVTGEGAPPAEPRAEVVERQPASLGEEIEPRPAPDFTLATLDGGSFRMSDQRGKVLVVNFWATWCAPCRIEIPDLIEMQSEMGSDGVQVVGISLDHDGPDAVQDFADEVAFNYPILLDEGEVAAQFGGVYALPTTIIVDRDGMVRHRISGIVTKNLLMPILDELTGSA